MKVVFNDYYDNELQVNNFHNANKDEKRLHRNVSRGNWEIAIIQECNDFNKECLISIGDYLLKEHSINTLLHEQGNALLLVLIEKLDYSRRLVQQAMLGDTEPMPEDFGWKIQNGVFEQGGYFFDKEWRITPAANEVLSEKEIHAFIKDIERQVKFNHGIDYAIVYKHEEKDVTILIQDQPLTKESIILLWDEY